MFLLCSLLLCSPYARMTYASPSFLCNMPPLPPFQFIGHTSHSFASVSPVSVPQFARFQLRSFSRFFFFHHFLSVAPCPSTRDGRCFNVPRRPPSFGWCSIRSNSQLRTTSTLVAKHKTHLLPRQSQSFCKRQTRLPNHSNLVSLTSGSSRPSPLKLLLQRTSLPFALETSEDVFAGSNHGVVAIVG